MSEAKYWWVVGEAIGSDGKEYHIETEVGVPSMGEAADFALVDESRLRGVGSLEWDGDFRMKDGMKYPNPSVEQIP